MQQAGDIEIDASHPSRLLRWRAQLVAIVLAVVVVIVIVVIVRQGLQMSQRRLWAIVVGA